MNKVSTKLYRVNFRYILNNLLNKNVWKSKWLLYDYDEMKIDLRLRYIDITENKLCLQVSQVGTRYNYSTFELPLATDHFNEVVFYQRLFASMRSVIRSYELDYIIAHSSYQKAYELSEKLNESNKQKALDHCEALQIDDDDIINSYVEWYVGENSQKYENDVMLKLQYTLQSGKYLMLGYLYQQHCKDYSNELLEVVKSKTDHLVIDNDIKTINKALELIEVNEMDNFDEAFDQAKEE